MKDQTEMKGMYCKTLQQLEDAWLSENTPEDKELHEASMRILRAEFNGGFYKPQIDGCSECYKND